MKRSEVVKDRAAPDLAHSRFGVDACSSRRGGVVQRRVVTSPRYRGFFFPFGAPSEKSSFGDEKPNERRGEHPPPTKKMRFQELFTPKWYIPDDTTADTQTDAETSAESAMLALLRHGTDGQMKNAAYALAALNVRLGGAATLVWLAKDGSAVQKEHALLAMWKVVACNEDAVGLFARCGATCVLASRINDGTDAQRHNAWMTLAHMATMTETHDAIRELVSSASASMNATQVLVAIARTTTSSSMRAWATNALCDSAQDTATGPLVDAILDIMKNGTSHEMERASRAMTRVSVSTLVERGGVPIITSALLRSESVSVQESSALVLCQIATTCPGHRREIRRSGGIEALARHVLRLTRGTCGAIVALYVLSNRAKIRAEIRAFGVTPALIGLVMRGSSDAAISFLMVLRLATDADGAEEIRAGGLNELRALVAHAETRPALWSVVRHDLTKLCECGPSIEWTDISFPSPDETTLRGRRVDITESAEMQQCDQRAAFGRRRHVASVMGWTRGPDNKTYAVTEHAPYGSLVDQACFVDPMRIATQLCTGLMDLADEGIAHAITLRNTRVFEIGAIRVKIGPPTGRADQVEVAFSLLLEHIFASSATPDVDAVVQRCRETPPPTFEEIHARLMSIREAPLCVVCMDLRSVYATIPCGHRCLCGVHAQRFVGIPCPVCRHLVSSVALIYDV